MLRVILKYIFILLALAIIGLFIMFGVFAVNLRNINYKKIYSQLVNYLEQEKSVVTVTRDGEKKIVLSCFYPDDRPHNAFNRTIDFSPKPGSRLIYVYGGSEIFVNFSREGNSYKGFPYLLEDYVKSSNTNEEVFNFGLYYFDSFNIKKLIAASIKLKKPDLIIYHTTGSTDLTKAYLMAVKSDIYFFSRYLVSKPFGPHWLNALAYRFFGKYFEPEAIGLCLKLGWLKIDWNEINRWEDLILSYYKNNIEEIIKLAKDNNIPLVLVIPATNLEERPYGKYPETRDFYNKGMREINYEKKFDYLTKAGDLDVFSIRTSRKSKVMNFLRSLEKRQGVYVFDLERELFNCHFDFGNSNYIDEAHLKNEAHLLISRKLYSYLREKKLIGNKNE